MVLQVNHTHDVIASSVKTALARFGIGEYNPDNSKDTVGDEVVCITTDEGSNMVKAFQDFEGAPCVCHRLQNALGDALKDDQAATLVRKVWSLIAVIIQYNL